MNVIALTASPRGKESQTRRLVEAILQGAEEAGAETELVDVCRLHIEYCTACEVCHRVGTCIHKDDFPALRKKILSADGLVFASPNYFRSVTAQLKTVIDRMSDIVHCQILLDKYACCASVSGGPQCREVTDYLAGILLGFGCNVVGQVEASVSSGPDALAAAETKAQALGRELAEAIAEQRVYPEQQKQHEVIGAYFLELLEHNKDQWPYEYRLVHAAGKDQL